MKRSFDFRPWLKPALVCVLGLCLIFRPGSLTATVARGVGFLIALVGAGKLVSFFSGSKKDFLELCGAILLLVLGFAIIKNPVSLERQACRVIGIVLLLQAIRGFVSPCAAHEKLSSTLCCVMGALLLVMPLTVSRLAVALCGGVVLVIGVGMVLDLLRGSRPGGEGDIIDA